MMMSCEPSLAGSIRFCQIGMLFLCALSLAGCGGSLDSSEGSGGNVLRNMVMFGGPTVPAAASGPADDDDLYCSPIEIAEGGATLRQGTSNDALRVQISIGETARECTPRSGTKGYTLKTGVEVSALLGPGGSTGSYPVTLRTVVKRGEKILAQRATRTVIAIAPGQLRGSATIIEDGIVVPEAARDVDIFITLDTAGAVRRARR